MEPTATTPTPATKPKSDPAAASLERRFAGELLRPGEPAYAEALRIHNAMFDERRPALIARCANAADIAAAIAYARDTDLPLSVRGGGHHVAGYASSDGGVVIDTRPMKWIDVDPRARTARAGAGVTWGDFDRATQDFGLAVTGGRASTTGIVGQALGSGSGWLERKLGIGADNLLSATLVTAEGEVLRASEEENAELFWGLRGAGANFGVVTELEFRLHPVGPVVLGGLMLYDGAHATEVLRLYRDYMETAPRELGSAPVLLQAPPLPFIPTELHGEPAVGMIVCWAGPIEKGQEALRPLREVIPPVVDQVEPTQYTAVQQIVDGFDPPGRRAYWKSDNLRALPDDAIDTLVEAAFPVPSPHTQIVLEPKGGAIGDLADEAMALPGRDAPWFFYVFAIWEDPAEDAEQIEWARGVAGALEPFTTAGMPLNFVAEAGRDRVRATFGQRKYARLVALKDSYDPDNVFRNCANIRPSGH